MIGLLLHGIALVGAAIVFLQQPLVGWRGEDEFLWDARDAVSNIAVDGNVELHVETVETLIRMAEMYHRRWQSSSGTAGLALLAVGAYAAIGVLRCWPRRQTKDTHNQPSEATSQ